MDDELGRDMLEAGMLYEAAGAGSAGLLEALVVFWRAMLANASNIEFPLAGGAAVCERPAPSPWFDAKRLLGGLPGGVVDSAPSAIC